MVRLLLKTWTAKMLLPLECARIIVMDINNIVSYTDRCKQHTKELGIHIFDLLRDVAFAPQRVPSGPSYRDPGIEIMGW